MGYMHGFTVQNWKARALGFKDDSFDFDEGTGAACVADGITRDSKNGHVITSLRGLAEALAFGYPQYAADASKIAVNAFMLHGTLEAVNREIGDYNFNTGLIPTDFLGRDFAGCTAAGFYLENRIINWTFIGDSRFVLLDDRGNIVVKTQDEGPNSKGSIDADILKKYGLKFKQAEGRRLIRSHYRNNPKEPLAYGALTGEEEAKQYITKGTTSAEKGDNALLLTDGIGDLLFPKNENGKEPYEIREEYLSRILAGDAEGLEALCQRNVHSEGTLVTWKVG